VTSRPGRVLPAALWPDMADRAPDLLAWFCDADDMAESISGRVPEFFSCAPSQEGTLEARTGLERDLGRWLARGELVRALRSSSTSCGNLRAAGEDFGDALRALIAALERAENPRTIADHTDFPLHSAVERVRVERDKLRNAMHAVAGTSAYCIAITNNGLQPLDQRQYEEKVTTRRSNALFADLLNPPAGGTHVVAGMKPARGRFKQVDLEYDYARVLVRLVTANRRVTAREIVEAVKGKPRGKGEEVRAPDKLVERLRREIDLKIGRRYRSIHTYGRGQSKLYEFRPPADLKYCLLVPPELADVRSA
jgi:hypothetical protein